MELGLSLGETMADAGSDLVLGLGMGVGVRREEETQRGRRDREARRELEFETGRCARPSPEPAVRLTLLPGLVPSLGLPWPLSSETNREVSTRGFDDVNRALSVAGAGAEEDEAAVAAATAAASSSPNNSSGSFAMDISAQGQGQGQDQAAPAADRACSRASDEDDGGSARKKLRLSKEQSAFLEESFKVRATPNPVRASAAGDAEKPSLLCSSTGLGPDS
jgi:homeobox-leucine zipper protein